MAKNDEFRQESLQDAQSIIQYMNRLKEGFEKRSLGFEMHDETFDFSPNGMVKLEVKAKKADGKTKLTLKMIWRDGEGLTTDDPLDVDDDS